MNTKTLEAIRKHGQSLLAAFSNATEKDPVALCKKLRRIETSLQRPLLDYCNGDFDAGENGEKLDAVTDGALKRIDALLRPLNWHIFVNRDPRGYALKLDDVQTREFNSRRAKNEPRIYTDMGGYGILAPDLSQ